MSTAYEILSMFIKAFPLIRVNLNDDRALYEYTGYKSGERLAEYARKIIADNHLPLTVRVMPTWRLVEIKYSPEMQVCYDFMQPINPHDIKTVKP